MITSTVGEGVSLEDFLACEKLAENIWLVTTSRLGVDNKNLVVQLQTGEKRKLFARNCKGFKPLDAKNWCTAARVYSTEFVSQGVQGGSPGAYGIYHVDIGEILPRPDGYKFDPVLHQMPKSIISLSPTLFLLDHSRLLEICGDHVKFCVLPFSVSVKGQIHADQESKRILAAAKSDGGVRAVLFDYENGLILQEVKY